jgi:protein TonB
MRARPDGRGFAWALAASVALHALVLFTWLKVPEPQPSAAAAAAPPVVARLAEVQIPDAPPPEAQKPERPRPPAPHKKRTPIAAPRPDAPELAPTRQEPAPQPPAAPASAAIASAPSSVPAEPDRTALDATTAAQYRLQLIGAARRYGQAYPQLARENNWNGNVVLDVVIQADGRAELALRRGSGHEVLDRQALDTFRRALRDVPVPASLRGRQLALEPLVVVYALKD